MAGSRSVLSLCLIFQRFLTPAIALGGVGGEAGNPHVPFPAPFSQHHGREDHTGAGQGLGGEGWKCSQVLFFPFFLVLRPGMWDLSAQTRERARTPCSGGAVLTTGLPGKPPKASVLQPFLHHLGLALTEQIKTQDGQLIN